MKHIIACLITILLSSNSFSQEDTLIAISHNSLLEIGSEVAYITTSGDTIIPYGQYLYYSSDTITYYGIVLKAGKYAIAIDSDGKELYEVFWYDNGADYASEGLFRIVKNGLIGYADIKTGHIVIEPQYQCAKPFKNGNAEVSYKCDRISSEEHWSWKNDSWIMIDKNGNKIDLNKPNSRTRVKSLIF